jgi:cation transport ATPase
MQFLRALRRSAWYAFVLFGILLFLHPAGLLAQTGASGTIEGVVEDPSAAVVANAVVTISNPVSGYTRTTSSGTLGISPSLTSRSTALHLTIMAPDFDNFTQDVRKAIQHLLDLLPSAATIRGQEGWEDVSISEISTGDEVRQPLVPTSVAVAEHFV